MKTLALLLLAFTTLPAFGDGGSSTVGPPGPSGLAHKAFYNDTNVQAEIEAAERAGFVGREDLSGIQFLRHENCRVPSEGATYTVCDYVFLSVHALKNPRDSALVKVSRVVVVGMGVVRVLPNQAAAKATVSQEIAGISPEAIYAALAVKAVDPRPLVDGMPPMGAVVLEKSVGGLACRKSSVVGPRGRASTVCQLSEGGDAKAIYAALALEEIDARPVVDGMPSMGAMIWEKAVGGLACRKVQGVYPGAKAEFSCSLSN